MVYKEKRGATPKYSATLKDVSGNVINPSTAFTKVIIKIYNTISGNILIQYTTESIVPEEWYQCAVSTTEIKWSIPSVVSEAVKHGENRIEIWTYSTDIDIPGGESEECFTGILNEFIDAMPDDDSDDVIETITDIDGNVYTSVIIGTQEWMVENLRTTKYADGTPIPNLTLDADWIAEDGTVGHDGAYCWYDNDIDNKADYGALYNWHAVNNVHGLAPEGWRVPSQSDITTLSNLLGGGGVAGGKLKEQGLVHWKTPNTGATNETGFTAIGSGMRDHSGVFGLDGILIDVNIRSVYWTTTLVFAKANRFWMEYDDAQSHEGSREKAAGFSVRCMRDVV